MRALGPIIAIIVVIALIASSTMYTVDQRQNAIVFQLGEVKEVVQRSGLHFKWPLLQNVRLFDMRILTFDDPEPLRFLTQGNRPVLVDSFVKWRVADVRQYYVSVQGDEIRARTVHDVVPGERDHIMSRVRDKVDQDLKRIGVEVIDVRLKRVDLPADVSESVYRRMDAQRVRGEGDAKSAAIYAAAFSQNPEFYAFYRSMEAYRSTFRGRNDLMLLEPNSDFF